MEPQDGGTPNPGGFGYLALVLFVGLCLAALAMSGQWTELDLRDHFAPTRLIAALGFQCAALYVTTVCWRSTVAQYAGTRINLAEAFTHNGILLVGKYIPGKIWGGLARGVMLHQRGAGVGSIVEATVLEQIMYMHAGLLVAGCSLAFVLTPIAGTLALLLGVASIALGGPVARGLLASAARFAARWRSDLAAKIPPASSISIGHYRRIVALYTVQWLLLGSILVSLFVPVDQLDNPALVLTYLGALPVAVLLGFVALWAPGGIGVREGTLIAALTITIPLELAAVVAIVYRLWCVALDLLNGLFGLLYMRRQHR